MSEAAISSIGSNGSYRLFMSHGSKDRWVAKQIREKLSKGEVHCFLDAIDIEDGDANFRQIIFDAVDRCNELFVLLTPSSVQRAWVFAEIGAAIASGRRIIAVSFGLEIEELYKRGVVSLLGNSRIWELNDVEDCIEAVFDRAKRPTNGV
jgi:hypothetical protein